MFKDMTVQEQKLELDKCKKGRRVQILILLEKNDRLKSKEISEMTGINHTNLSSYTKRLEDNGLITIYDESKFKKPEEANYKFLYHSITDAGRLLIANLDQEVQKHYADFDK
jgi:DNA-binding MarR family transcriptional regulator